MSRRGGIVKRRPEVWGITEARVFGAVSKADLWDAACYLGMALGDESIADHGKRGFAKLVNELKLLSAQNIIPARVLTNVNSALRGRPEPASNAITPSPEEADEHLRNPL